MFQGCRWKLAGTGWTLCIFIFRCENVMGLRGNSLFVMAIDVVDASVWSCCSSGRLYHIILYLYENEKNNDEGRVESKIKKI